MTITTGFSRLNRGQRIEYLIEHSKLDVENGYQLHDFDASEVENQKVFEGMVENYIGNFPVPMGIVANMVLNGESLAIPFVTEESSVIAAASKAAKFWAARGGFHAVVSSVTKKGQVHFTWNGIPEQIRKLFPEIRKKLLFSSGGLTQKMEQRGGGIKEIQLIDLTRELHNYYQLDVSFETAEAMGANFINSCLESLAAVLSNLSELNTADNHVEIIMSVLSNYTPDCRVNCHVECPVEALTGWSQNMTGRIFATKFRQAVDIANLNIQRAVTHNKGLFNGIDAVMLATGNDWRAAAASAHAYASKDGTYKGLTTIQLTDNQFRYELELPLALGTVGGITQIHPVVKKSMAIMNHPDAQKLMMIAAASGLANNFAAIASLITTGIQDGHMRMHLANLLTQLHASQSEREFAVSHFSHKTVSYAAVENLIGQIRNEI
ncbi:MAG: hydroxymethylglutaryl-CoA reductase [Prolixibacteraceae bacterium]